MNKYLDDLKKALSSEQLTPITDEQAAEIETRLDTAPKSGEVIIEKTETKNGWSYKITFNPDTFNFPSLQSRK